VSTIEIDTNAAEELTAAEARPQLLFVIPAFNEEQNLPSLFADLAQTTDLLGTGSRIFIVDDGSDDATSSLVESYPGPLPVELVRLEVNQGPGAAFRSGFSSALSCAGPDALIVTLEADTTGDLGALPQMLDEVRHGADVVLAETSARFRGSARFDDELAISVEVEALGTTSMVVTYTARRDGEVLVEGRTVYVFVDPASMGKRAIPAAVRSRLAGYETGTSTAAG
jgi:acyl-CoA thioesterase FadM